MRFNDDIIIMPLQAATQWDALSHVYYEDKLYNGFPANSVTSLGAFHCGIDKVDSKGITSRGVLLDIVATARRGDLLRTRRPDHAGRTRRGGRARRASRSDAATSCWSEPVGGHGFWRPATAREPGAGLDWTCASWLHDHEVGRGRRRQPDGREPGVRRRRRVPADAHAVSARHGPDARRVLGPRRRWPPTAPPTVCTNSSSSHRR